MGIVKKILQKGKPIIAAAKKFAPAIKAGAKVAGLVGTVVTAGTLIERTAEKLGVRGGAGFIGKNPKDTKKKRRRGKVPKTVRKWATRITGRRKQEERIVKDLFGAGGGKVIKAPKKTSSSGSISRAEALSALRD